MRLAGRTAVITGASRGLGAGLAQTFAERGLRLGLCARSAPVLADGPALHAARLDVRDPAAVAAFAAAVEARFGAIDLWVNNAGVLEPIAPLREVEPDAARLHLEVNVLGVLHGSQAFVRHLHRRGGEGVLVNVPSGAAQKPYAGWSVYCAAKAAVERMTECVALEEAAHGVRALFLRDLIKHQNFFRLEDVTRFATSAVTQDYLEYITDIVLLEAYLTATNSHGAP